MSATIKLMVIVALTCKLNSISLLFIQWMTKFLFFPELAEEPVVIAGTRGISPTALIVADK